MNVTSTDCTMSCMQIFGRGRRKEAIAGPSMSTPLVLPLAVDGFDHLRFVSLYCILNTLQTFFTETTRQPHLQYIYCTGAATVTTARSPGAKVSYCILSLPVPLGKYDCTYNRMMKCKPFTFPLLNSSLYTVYCICRVSTFGCCSCGKEHTTM